MKIFDSDDYLEDEDGIVEGLEWKALVEDPIKEILKSVHIIATGTVGRWDGVYDGGKVLEDYNDFLSILKDCEYFKIDLEDDGLHIIASHHDGKNHFILRQLKDPEGMDAFYEYEGNPEFSERKFHQLLMQDTLSKPLEMKGVK